MSITLKNKIQNKQAKIAVLGMGYVGLPLAVNFAHQGYQVFGIDKDEDRISQLIQSVSYITDMPSATVAAVRANGKFVPTTDFDYLSQADAIIICVPTPLKRKYTPDISYIAGAIKEVSKRIKKDTLVVLESTTYPGTTDELVLPVLNTRKHKVGRDIFVSFSPERIDPGNKSYDVTKIPKLVGGITPVCGQLTKLLYERIIEEIHLLSSAKAAEMTKLLENSFRIINIGWINEVAMMCHRLNIDVWEVIDAAKTKPFGFMPFYPGLGVGGHCIPDDPLYLYWKAKQYGFSSKYIKLSADTNTNMPAYAVECLAGLLKKSRKKLKGAKVLVLGATYKKDVKDLRKSPSLKLIEILQDKKAVVSYHDPIVSYLKINGINLNSVPLTAQNLRSFDCVVVAVDHTAVDYGLIKDNAKLVYDIKNVYKNHPSRNIVRF